MKFVYPSADWVREFAAQINSNESYRKSAARWTYGAVGLVCQSGGSAAVPEDVGIWLDLHEGRCRDAGIVSPDQARKAPFHVTAEYARWKQVIRRELDPVQAMIQGKLRLSGNLTVVIRFVRATNELVRTAGTVPTVFPDE